MRVLSKWCLFGLAGCSVFAGAVLCSLPSCAGLFSAQNRFPVRASAFPYYAKGVSWSDDWGYMKQGIPSFAATDTADKLDYRQFAEVVEGLASMIITIANQP